MRCPWWPPCRGRRRRPTTRVAPGRRWRGSDAGRARCRGRRGPRAPRCWSRPAPCSTSSARPWRRCRSPDSKSSPPGCWQGTPCRFGPDRPIAPACRGRQQPTARLCRGGPPPGARTIPARGRRRRRAYVALPRRVHLALRLRRSAPSDGRRRAGGMPSLRRPVARAGAGPEATHAPQWSPAPGCEGSDPRSPTRGPRRRRGPPHPPRVPGHTLRWSMTGAKESRLVPEHSRTTDVGIGFVAYGRKITGPPPAAVANPGGTRVRHAHCSPARLLPGSVPIGPTGAAAQMAHRVQRPGGGTRRQPGRPHGATLEPPGRRRQR